MYSDGGITPDYIVSVDTMTNFESKFWNKNYNFLYEKSFDILDQNRKTIKNNLKTFFIDAEKKILKCGINPNSRPQDLKPIDFEKLSKILI